MRITKLLSLPLAHLDRVNDVVGVDLLQSLTATDRLHGDPSVERRNVGSAFANRWEPLVRGGAPPHRLTMGPLQKGQSTSVCQPPLSILPTMKSVASQPPLQWICVTV